MTRLVIAMAPLTLRQDIRRSATRKPPVAPELTNDRRSVRSQLRSRTMEPSAAENDLYHGLRQAERTLPTSAYLDAGGISARPRGDLVPALDHGLPRGRHRRAAGLQGLHHRHAGSAGRARRDRRPARLPQHLPPSRLAALPGGERPAEGAAPDLPLSFMVLFAARRPRSRAIEDAAGRFSEIRLSALFGRAVGVARLRLRQSRREREQIRSPKPSMRARRTCRTGRWKTWSAGTSSPR